MKSKDCCGRGNFSPDLSPGIPRRRIDSFEAQPAIQPNPRVQVKFVLVRSFWSRYGKNKTVIEMFYTSEHFRKHWKCGESTCWHPEHKGKCEAVKESQTDWRCFRSFRNYSCSRIARVIYFQFLECEGYYLTKN